MIHVNNLYKNFGTHQVLKGVNVHVKRGEIRVILGLSGSGKTVLMKHLIGLLHPDSGEILVDGEDITKLDHKNMIRVREKFGMVFQQAALFDSMTVGENVAFPLKEHTDFPKEEIHKRVLDKLDLVGLKAAINKHPSELSGGMRKRVGLARAVILDPSCILYDEPTTGIDPITTENVDGMILDAKKYLNITSVVISHDVGSALRIADDVAVINEGIIIEDCKGSALHDSHDPFVKKFLNAWFSKQ